MFRKTLIVLMVFMFTISGIGVAFSSEGPSGNKRKGKYTYRKVYKACAEAGQVESSVPSISPADKKMAQWSTIFENRQFDEFGCLEHWENLSDSDINDIYSYFYNYAADSPTPATCK